MTMLELEYRLMNDLNKLGVKTDFELVLKRYSKSFYGRYNPNNKKLILYVYPYSKTTVMYPYEKLFKTLLHEVCHHRQHSDPDFVRIKGVMHNKDFYKMYNHLLERSYKLRILRR